MLPMKAAQSKKEDFEVRDGDDEVLKRNKYEKGLESFYKYYHYKPAQFFSSSPPMHSSRPSQT